MSPDAGRTPASCRNLKGTATRARDSTPDEREENHETPGASSVAEHGEKPSRDRKTENATQTRHLPPVSVSASERA